MRSNAPEPWDDEWRTLFQDIVVDLGLTRHRLRRFREIVEDESLLESTAPASGRFLRRQRLRLLESRATVGISTAADALRWFRPRAVAALSDDTQSSDDRLRIAIDEIKTLLTDNGEDGYRGAESETG